MIDQNTGAQNSPNLPEPSGRWPHGPTSFEVRFGNNTTRIVVAIIAIPLILGLVFVGGGWFTLLVAAMSTGALLEFYWMLERKGIQPNKKLGVTAGILLVLSFSYSDLDGLLEGIILWLNGSVAAPHGDGMGPSPLLSFPFSTLLTLFVVFSSLIIELRRDNRQALYNVMGTLTGFFYVSFCMATLLGLHHFVADTARLSPPLQMDGVVLKLPLVSDFASYQGGIVVLVMLVGIWTCDSFAYFGGRAFGRHKLFERVSPKKTWEGAICGAVAAIAACVGLTAWLAGLTWYDGLFIGIAAGVFGQLGDLVESHIKRGCGVKDSSQIIPGHGGILDRFDSLLFVAPLVYFYMRIMEFPVG